MADDPVARELQRGTALATDLALVGLVVTLRAALTQPLLDDAYIVLAVARNAVTGVGPHLDPGSGDAVLSTLLWPGLLGLAMKAGAAPVAALRALGLAAELTLALLARRLGSELSGSLGAGALAAAALVTHPLLLLPSLGGMETALAIALIAASALAMARGRHALAALVAGALPWARVDGWLAAAVLLTALAALRRPRPLSGWSAGALLAAAAPLTHRLLFGTWLPATVTAKAAILTSDYGSALAALGREFARALAGQSAYWLIEPTAHLLLVPLAVLGAATLRRGRKHPALLAVTVWAALYVAAFVLAGREYARNFPWYFAPPLLAVVLLAAQGAAALVRRVPKGAQRRFARLAPLTPLAVGVLVFATVERGQQRVAKSFTAHRERAYAAAATWLGRRGPAASVASNEVGALAWYSPPGTAVVDLFGLSRRPEDRGLSVAQLLARRRPEAIVGRVDFQLRAEAEAAAPGEYVWVRAGTLDLGLTPALAARLRPHAAELERIYSELGGSRAMGASRAAVSSSSFQSP